MKNLFAFGYEAARSLSASENKAVEDLISDYEEHAKECGEDNIDADGTCLVCGKTDLL